MGQCQAARGIEDEFGTAKALDYLVGEGFLKRPSRNAFSPGLVGQSP